MSTKSGTLQTLRCKKGVILPCESVNLQKFQCIEVKLCEGEIPEKISPCYIEHFLQCTTEIARSAMHRSLQARAKAYQLFFGATVK